MIVGTPRNLENHQIVEMQFLLMIMNVGAFRQFLEYFRRFASSGDSIAQGNIWTQKSCHNAAETAVH